MGQAGSSGSDERNMKRRPLNSCEKSLSHADRFNCGRLD